MAHSRRASTALNYQHKWKRYREWCKDNGHTISNPTVQKVAEFLVHLRLDCQLSTSAIKGYKAMLNGIFGLRGLDLNKERVLQDIIKACTSRSQMPRRDLRPSWNVDVVLRFLARAPFEPLQRSSILDLTKKTLFLLALATAQRVGEIQALSSRASWQGQDIILTYLPEFVAKTETEANPLPREFRVLSLSSYVGRQEEERLLCPVRAVSHYLHRTAADSRPRNLFVAVRRPSRPMSKAAISFLLRATIKEAHAAFPDSAGPEFRVRAHDVRGIATSMLLWKNCSIPAILRAGHWRSRSVFADRYLRDLAREDGDLFTLGPVVAAGHVLPGGRGDSASQVVP